MGGFGELAAKQLHQPVKIGHSRMNEIMIIEVVECRDRRRGAPQSLLTQPRRKFQTRRLDTTAVGDAPSGGHGTVERVGDNRVHNADGLLWTLAPTCSRTIGHLKNNLNHLGGFAVLLK